MDGPRSETARGGRSHRRAAPSLALVLWRWRWEVATLVVTPVVAIELDRGLWPGSALTLTGLVLSWRPARRELRARALAVLVQHLMRRTFVEADVVSPQCYLPAIVWTSPQPEGERLFLFLPAGLQPADVAAAAPALRRAVWADAVHVHPHPRLPRLLVLDIHRSEVRQAWS